jgi:SAM-dependent methyltransferase
MPKRLIKRLLRPITLRFFYRVELALNARIAPLQAELAALRDDVAALKGDVPRLRDDIAALKGYVPSLLNSVSSLGAVMREAKRAERRAEERSEELAAQVAALRSAREELAGRMSVLEAGGTASAHRAAIEERIGGVEARLEFVRNELMFELRYGGASRGFTPAAAEPRILNPGKLAASRDDVRLNLGCGHIPLESHLNVDGRELPGVDIVADVGRLPFEPATVDEIFSAHLLEHFPVEELKRSLMPYWVSLLRPGGRFRAVVPDTEAMISSYHAGEMSFGDLRMVTFGGQEYDGDFHFNMFSRDSLRSCLRDAGLVDVEMVAAKRRNGLCFEMEVVGRKPDAVRPQEAA